MITILDYGMGNILSISNMLNYLGIKSTIADKPSELIKAERLILPGVGSFDNAMTKLCKIGFDDALKELLVNKKILCLGICLGMQLLFESSEEGSLNGLSLIPGKVVKFKLHKNLENLKIPQMGWNTVCPTRNSILFNSDSEEQRYYFVHSYHVKCNNSNHITGTTSYGYSFTSAVEFENILGVQFHPEKSHKFGMSILRRFAEAKC